MSVAPASFMTDLTMQGIIEDIELAYYYIFRSWQFAIWDSDATSPLEASLVPILERHWRPDSWNGLIRETRLPKGRVKSSEGIFHQQTSTNNGTIGGYGISIDSGHYGWYIFPAVCRPQPSERRHEQVAPPDPRYRLTFSSILCSQIRAFRRWKSMPLIY